MGDSRAYLGKGWKFPFKFNANGGVQTTADRTDGTTSDDGQKRHLFGATRQVLETSNGERFMQGEFGTKIMDLVFDQMSDTLSGLLSYYASSGIQRWDKRINPVFVDAIGDPKAGMFRVLVRYEVAGANIIGNMVFPFYTRGIVE